MYTGQRPSIFIRDRPIFSSERMLHKDYDRKGSVAKKKLWSRASRLGAKMNSLSVSRQSQSNPDSDSECQSRQSRVE
jgi:hypothetical protein